MITERDREIINFIHTIGYASITHIAGMFFLDGKYGYDSARKRLKLIKENSQYLRSARNFDTNELIYYPFDSKLKNISKHKIITLDYLCGLKKLGCDIQKIEIEKNFNNIIPDIFISFIFEDYKYYQLVEVQIRHDYVDINRFNDVMSTIYKQTNDTIPSIVIIQNTKKDYSLENETPMTVFQIDTKLKNIAKVLI